MTKSIDIQTRPSVRSTQALRVVLACLGLLTVLVAANAAFGGLGTLGLQGSGDYFRVTDESTYLIRDSHAHFYGGVYLVVGLVLIGGAIDVRRFRPALNVVFAMIFVGGLARLTQLEPGVTFGADLLVSSLVELLGMPILAVWLVRATAPRRTGAPTPVVAAV